MSVLCVRLLQEVFKAAFSGFLATRDIFFLLELKEAGEEMTI